MISYGNIFSSLTFNPNELASEDLNDYKTLKVKIEFDNISENSKYCLL